MIIGLPSFLISEVLKFDPLTSLIITEGMVLTFPVLCAERLMVRRVKTSEENNAFI
jgi:hypothetical protein